MTAPAAIAGSLVDAKNVNMHKCVRLSIDVPAELAEQIIKAFGWPTMATPVAVAVARLKSPPQIEAQPEEKRHFSELPPPQQAGILCNERRFHKFLEETRKVRWQLLLSAEPNPVEVAKRIVREWCGVPTRADLVKPDALEKWRRLEAEFQAWKTAA